MIKIDNFIMNPPYTTGCDGITEKIIRATKETKPSNLVSIQPMYKDTLYKTATWVKNPFESYNPMNTNLWIFDNAPFFSDTKTGLAIKLNGKDLGLGSLANERNSVILSQKTRSTRILRLGE